MAEGYRPLDQAANDALMRELLSEPRPMEEPSIATLIGELVADGQDLVRKEIDLAKQEVRNELNKAKDTAISIAIGGAMAAIAGLLFVLMLVHLLASVFSLTLWASYLLVGLVFAIVGGVLLMRARSKMSDIHLAPQETVHEVKKDVAWIKQQTNSDKT